MSFVLKIVNDWAQSRRLEELFLEAEGHAAQMGEEGPEIRERIKLARTLVDG